jgi:hypothetical protein
MYRVMNIFERYSALQWNGVQGFRTPFSMEIELIFDS